jgi:hypothetical protein
MRDTYGHASPEYRAYLKSALWREVRRSYFTRHPRKCQACDRKGKYRKWYQVWKPRLFIILHHARYDEQRRCPGSEPDDALRAVCSNHHTEIHARYDDGQFRTLEEATDWVIAQGQRKLQRQRAK